MRALVTLTGNLLAERTLELAGDWRPGSTHRATSETFQVGGKGFNVAKMLQRLGCPVTALGFAGGAAGDECRAWLANHAAYAHRLFPTQAPTRTGVVVRAPGSAETTFLAPDRPPDEAAFRACAQFLDTLPAASGVALCGSFPGWSSVSAAPLRAALVRLAQEGRLAADTYGPPLADLVREPLRLVKINRQEFEQLDATDSRERPWPERLASALQRWPVQAWVVTDGPRPVWYASADGIGSAMPPTVTEVSATGCGDVLFAALLATWFWPAGSLADAIGNALPLAALNAQSAGIADFLIPPSFKRFAVVDETS